MTTLSLNTWQSVRGEILHRIHTRRWKPGDFIPNEQELADEFGCARATVNRALRSVADEGLIDRRRKAGTQVSINPTRKATLSIPVIRLDIEKQNKRYSHALVTSRQSTPPPDIRARMKLSKGEQALHIQALHLADGRPYVFENRWINCGFLPASLKVDFEQENANEWLLRNAPFTGGDFVFSAISADATLAKALETEIGTALFQFRRNTWNEDNSITYAELTYAPGYEMQFNG